jgi:hypothetical protein
MARPTPRRPDIRIHSSRELSMKTVNAIIAIIIGLTVNVSLLHSMFAGTGLTGELDQEIVVERIRDAAIRIETVPTTVTTTTPHTYIDISSLRDLLHDKTVVWSSDVRRPWLDTETSSQPPAQILLTNYGWNHPNERRGLNHVRSLRHTALLNGIINHPWFHPTAWEDMLSNKTSIDPNIRYYVFLDKNTCFEANWPHYGLDEKRNYDRSHNRTLVREKRHCKQFPRCREIHHVIQSPLFKSGANVTLVVFECRGFGQPSSYRNKLTKDYPMSMVTLSSKQSQILQSADQGQPPPAVNPVTLSPKEVHAIQTCNESGRKFLLTFAGQFRDPVRLDMRHLHDGKDVLMLYPHNISQYINGSFSDLLTASKFAATPRGDNLYSY